MSPSTPEISLSEALRGVLLAMAQSKPGARKGIDSVLHRAGATLLSLLADHGVDQRGRCRLCRRPGAVLGLRRRPCRVHSKAEMWLRLPPELVLSFLVKELKLAPAIVGDPFSTDSSQPPGPTAAACFPPLR